jgi:hypothetical protein
MKKIFKNSILKLNKSKFSSSILDLAKDNKWEAQKVTNAEQCELKPPTLIGEGELNLFQKNDNTSYIKDRFLVCIKDAKIKCGYVVLGNGHFISENSLRDNYWSSHPWKLHSYLTSLPPVFRPRLS